MRATRQHFLLAFDVKDQVLIAMHLDLDKLLLISHEGAKEEARKKQKENEISVKAQILPVWELGLSRFFFLSCTLLKATWLCAATRIMNSGKNEQKSQPGSKSRVSRPSPSTTPSLLTKMA